MSFARWTSFDECKMEQMQIGHDEAYAKEICEGIQDRAEKGTLFKALPPLEILKGHDGDLVVGGYASWEIIDAEGDYVTTEAMVNYLAKFFNLPSEYRNISIDHTNFQIGIALLHYPDENPQYFSHVHEKGMYLIAKIRNDSLKRTQHYRDLIRKGEYKMYSISGEALRRETVVEDNKSFRKIYDIDPFETAIVKEGMNAKAGPLETLSKQHLDTSTYLRAVEVKKKVVERDGKWCVVHCHGEEAGETIKCFPTKGEAEAMHRAIQANKSLTKDDRPPTLAKQSDLPVHWTSAEIKASNQLDEIQKDKHPKR